VGVPRYPVMMLVHDMRINAVILLICALEAIELRQYEAAERLRVKAAQYDAKADAIEACESGALLN
jgi:hypothetical protein